MSSGKVLPKPDADTRPYWAAAARGDLILQYCTQCGKPRFYPRLLCPFCHSDEHEWRPSSGAGVIYSFSVVHRAPLPEFQGDVPYVVALVDLVDGVRMFANVVADPKAVRIGQRVKVTFRKETDDIGIPEFVLDADGGQP